MIFEIDNVELYFKDKRILNGIYLKANTGKVTAVLGSNGSGKSCLMQITFGSMKAKYKLVRIDNKPILKPLYLTKLVKFLPQHHLIPNFFKIITAFKSYDVNWNEFASQFEAFSIFKNYKINKLSGGERRVIETYLILKSNSKLVLLDEPFSHLAPLYIEQIKTLITQEKKHKAIIISDHMYKHIIDVSDEIYLLKNGCTKHIKNLLELEDYKYLSEGSLS